jgi:hypothetical protein
MAKENQTPEEKTSADLVKAEAERERQLTALRAEFEDFKKAKNPAPDAQAKLAEKLDKFFEMNPPKPNPEKPNEKPSSGLVQFLKEIGILA